MIWHFFRRLLPIAWKVRFRRIRARLIDPCNRGVVITIAGERVRVPAYFLGGGRAHYENEAVARFGAWLDRHSAAHIVDCGCSLSLYGLIALSRSSACRVTGIDPDLVSLKCTRRLCEQTPAWQERLDLVHGFLGSVHDSGCALSAAVSATARQLDDPAVADYIGASDYRSADDPAWTAMPRHSLDGLFANEMPVRNCLLKIDVEGSELEVLRGATQPMAGRQPTILLSAHPQFYDRLGVSFVAIRSLLESAGYAPQLISQDHEEHWWCEPVASTVCHG